MAGRGTIAEIDEPSLRELAEVAAEAAKRAFAKHSNFRVGAAVRTKAGAVFSGCNVENDSYGITSCAERNAVFAAVRAEGPSMRVIAVAIYAKRPIGEKAPRTVPPCGACRQVLSQFVAKGGDATVTFLKDGKFTTMTVSELLPIKFELEP